MDDSEMMAMILAAFREESAELLAGAERCLGAIGDGSEEARSELARILHTLKGAASASGQAETTARVHAWEEALDELGETGPADPRALDAAYRRLEDLQARIRGELDEAQGRGRGRVREDIGEDLGFPRPGPTPETVDPSGPSDSRRAGFAPARAGDLRDMQQGEAPVRLEVDETLRVRPERIDALEGALGDLAILQLEGERSAERATRLRRYLKSTVRAWRRLEALLRHTRGDRRRAERDLVRLRQELGENLREAYRESFQLSRELPVRQDQERVLADSLGDELRGMRLMPLQAFFEKFQQVVRHTARELDKIVKVRIEARGAELDRPVLLQLKDPLLHLVRNSVVHGIEKPDERRRLGKNERGTIVLEGRCEGGRAILRIADDGAGVDEARVRDSARRRGIEGAGELPLLDILTHRGFSTHGSADDFAGRGVGLDVVADRVRDLDGTLLLENFPGMGCCFELDVPISTSTSPGLIVEVAGRRFGVVLHHVECVLRVERQSVRLVEGRPIIEVGERPVSLVSLASLLGLRESERSGKLSVIVVALGERRLALTVDDVPGEQNLIIKPLGEAFAGLAVIQGGAILADQEILPILQVTELLARAGQGRRSGGIVAEPRVLRPEKQRGEVPRGDSGGSRTALVVDDSVTMRLLERSVLESAGWNVVVAEDGQAAVDWLSRGESCAVVVTDIQMPRLDGYGVCRAVRSSSRPNLPLVVVTTLKTEEEIAKAADAGADAYIIKSDFEESIFLDTVTRLVDGPQGSRP